MKRSRLGPGRKSLERGSTFAAEREPMKRRPAKARPRARAPAREAQPSWWNGEIRGLACACCEASAVHGHHVIPVQVLERTGAPLWDRRNRMPVAQRCHFDHHNAARRLPLPREHPVWAFADEHGLRWYLEKTYP